LDRPGARTLLAVFAVFVLWVIDFLAMILIGLQGIGQTI